MLVCPLFCCKQKTAYEMRISDCSSDVFSSDLLAVPGMGVLVRQQVGEAGLLLPVGEIAGADAVLAGALVLQADAAHLPGQREQELVVVVMLRAIQLQRQLGRT